MTQFLALCALTAVVIVQVVQAQTCPAGYFADAATALCYPCARGSTSTAGGACFICPSGFYAPSAGSIQCFPCSAGRISTVAGEACVASCSKKDDKGNKGKRSLREDEEEAEVEADSMFSF